MNKRPSDSEVTDDDGRGHRGQSDVLALVILFGMIFVGATAIIITGGLLVDSVQEDSSHQLAQDTAEQTHQRIVEASSSGDTREVPNVDGGAVSEEIFDSGQIELEMADGADSCGAPVSEPVSENLGAIEYDAGDRQVIYEGGAIWERTESGYSVRRAPGINYTDGRSRISLTVLNGTDENDDGETVVQPNRSDTRRFNQELSDMILDCRLDGYHDLNVTVESDHVVAWEQYFEESVAAGNSEATVTTVDDDTIRLNIEGLSDEIDFEEWLVVHEWERRADDARIESGNEGLNTSVRVRNTGPIATNGTVTLDIDGGPSTTEPVDDLGRGELTWVDLEISPTALSNQLTPGEIYDYNVTIRPTAADQWTYEGENTTVSHSFYFGEPSDVFQVMNVGHSVDDETVEVEGLIGNIGTEQGEQDVEMELRHVPTDETVGSNVPPVETNLSSNATGTVSWTLNRSTIAGGEYEYTISTEDGSDTGTFDVSSFEGGETGVTTGTVGTGTITVLGTEVSAESLLSVEVPPGEREDTTLERVDRGMLMPTVVGDRAYYGASWEPVERPDGGWVPAERVGGDLEPVSAAPNCGGHPTEYRTRTSETDDHWDGWDVDDCWDEPDGFVWNDSGGYELEWAIAGETTRNGGDAVPRSETPWTFGGDADQTFSKNWAPVASEVVVEQDSTEDRYHEWNPGPTDHEENLNTHTTQEREWTQQIYLESGSRVTVTSSYFACATRWNSYYTHANTRTDDLGYTWRDYECSNRVGLGNRVDASGDSEDEGVRVLTDGDEVPVLRAGYPDQRNATEVLNRGAADRINATTGELELGDNEAVFLIELTDTSPSWEQAQTQDSYGDPNYNDVIVLFEYEAIVQEIVVDGTSGPDDNDGFDPGTPGRGDTDSGTGGEGSNIETDVTHVVIG